MKPDCYFSGTIVCPANLDEKERRELLHEVQDHGGHVEGDLKLWTSHLVVNDSKEQDSRTREMQNCAAGSGSYPAALRSDHFLCNPVENIKVVTLDWVKECKKKKELLDETPFLVDLSQKVGAESQPGLPLELDRDSVLYVQGADGSAEDKSINVLPQYVDRAKELFGLRTTDKFSDEVTHFVSCYDKGDEFDKASAPPPPLKAVGLLAVTIFTDRLLRGASISSPRFGLQIVLRKKTGAFPFR